MSKQIILYNKLAGHGKAAVDVHEFSKRFENPVVIDVTAENGYSDFFEMLSEDDDIVICGGDGTLNHFVNNIHGKDIKNKVFYHAIGSGNDFLRDVADVSDTFIEITKYVTDLPTVNVNGMERVFINGIGFGIDGYCCEVGDELKEKSDKPVDYAGIAIKGLLFHFNPVNATVTVDGVKHEFKKVWIAPAMNGRYYGGGIMPTPSQDRLNPERKLSTLIFHGSGRLKTLMIFPKLFKGEHLAHKKHITLLEGKDIKVSFDRPCALQIDGETVKNVTEYSATSSALVKSIDK